VLKYIIRRIILAIPVLLGVSVISFFVMQLAPGDFLDTYRINPNITREKIQELETLYGLDKDPVTQYFLWLGNILKGNWGYSFVYKIDVWQVMLRRLEATLLLGVTTFIFTWGIGIPLGITAALHQYKVTDQTLSTIGLIGISIPNFFFALLWLMFAANTGVFPIGGMLSREFANMPWYAQIGDFFWHVAGPVITLGTASLAGTMRIMRGQMLDEMNQDYAEFARAKGMPSDVVIYKHTLRNAINPVITSLGFSLSAILGGALITEYVFSWPGLGTLMRDAIFQQDIFLVMANLLLQGILLIIGNLLADILLAASDPRVRLRMSA